MRLDAEGAVILAQPCVGLDGEQRSPSGTVASPSPLRERLWITGALHAQIGAKCVICLTI